MLVKRYMLSIFFVFSTSCFDGVPVQDETKNKQVLFNPKANRIKIDLSMLDKRLTSEEAQSFIEKFSKTTNVNWDPDKKYNLENFVSKDRLKQAIGLLTKTSETLGPNAPNRATRYSGNNLNCINCHMAGKSGLPGTRKYSMPWFNIVGKYPMFESKEMKIITLEQRIVGMFGKGQVQVKVNDPEVKLIAEYIVWLNSAQESPRDNLYRWLTFSGKSRKKFRSDDVTYKELEFDEPSNPCKGKDLYDQHCQSCHQQDGKGVKMENFDRGGGYTFPPIAGEDSYDNGGHVYLIPILASMIYVSMPTGLASFNKPFLKPKEAIDIAAYINSGFSRVHNKNRIYSYPEKDFMPDSFVIPEQFGLDPIKLMQGFPTREFKLKCDPEFKATKKEQEYLNKKFGPYKKPY